MCYTSVSRYRRGVVTLNVIIIIFLIMIFPLGYQFINKFFDVFDVVDPIESCSEEKKVGSMENNSKKALILGNDTDEFVRLLRKQDISCTVITDSNLLLDPSNSYDYLIAVSHSDLDNLMTCSIGSKRMGIKRMIALCNFSYNRKIYEDNHIPYLYGENMKATQFINKLLSTSLIRGGDGNVHH